MADTYKLTYFDLRALGEPIRWILKVAGVPFEDERIELNKWSELKSDPRFPLGQLPVLRHNGQDLTQSLAIMRYLANKFGFVSSDPLLNYRSDQISEIAEDARILVRPLVLEQDPEEKEIKRKNILENVIPRFLQQLSNLVSLTDGDFVVGDKPTYGDFCLANWLDIWEQILDANILDDYPVLKKQKEAVVNLPAIKEWIALRPQTFV